LLTFPQNFEIVNWSKVNSTINPNSHISPDGNQTASTLNINSNQGTLRQVNIPVLSNTSYTASIWIYNAPRNITAILIAETLGGSGFTLVNADTANNGTWTRYEVTHTTGASVTQIRVQIGDNGTLAGDEYILWGAQLEVGSSATEYFPTNIGQPRFDWASTEVVANKNLLSYTEDFNNWSKTNITVTSDTTTDPLGGNTADAIFETSATGFHISFQLAGTIGMQQIFTVYVKANSRDFVGFKSSNAGVPGTTNVSVFDLVNITVSRQVSTHIASISDAGDGWRKITVITSSQDACQLLSMSDSTTLNYSGDITKGFYAWGAQLELGDTATDYQPIAQPTTSTPLAANPTSNGLPYSMVQGCYRRSMGKD